MARSYKKEKGGSAKMKAYVAEKNLGKEKFEPEQSKFGKFSTRQDKLEAKNANRSLKKPPARKANQIYGIIYKSPELFR